MRRNLVEEGMIVGAELGVVQHIVQEVEHMQPPPLRRWARRLLRAAGERRSKGDQVLPKGGRAGMRGDQMLEDPLLAFLLSAKENISKCLAGAQRLMLKTEWRVCSKPERWLVSTWRRLR